MDGDSGDDLLDSLMVNMRETLARVLNAEAALQLIIGDDHEPPPDLITGDG